MGTGNQDGSDKAGDSALRRQFLELEAAGAAVAATWLRHPALREVTLRHRSRAEAAIAPIADQLPNQLRTLELLLYVVGVRPMDCDLRQEPVPRWYLRPEQAAQMPAIVNALDRVLADAAADFSNTGIPVDAGSASDLIVIGELLLLDVDFEAPVEQLVAALQPLPPAAITPDARGTIVRRRTTNGIERTIGQVRAAYELHLEGARPPAPYAGGKQRATPEATLIRREALRKVRAAFPDTTVALILRSFDRPVAGVPSDKPATSGAYLRQLLHQALGTAPDRPAQSTLYEDFRAISQSTEGQGEEEVSG